MLGTRPLAEAPMPTLALTLALMPTLTLSLTHTTPAALVDALASTDTLTRPTVRATMFGAQPAACEGAPPAQNPCS